MGLLEGEMHYMKYSEGKVISLLPKQVSMTK